MSKTTVGPTFHFNQNLHKRKHLLRGRSESLIALSYNFAQMKRGMIPATEDQKREESVDPVTYNMLTEQVKRKREGFTMVQSMVTRISKCMTFPFVKTDECILKSHLHFILHSGCF